MLTHAKAGGGKWQASTRVWLVLACVLASLLFVLFQGGKLALMVFVILAVLSVYLFLGKWSGISRTKGDRAIGMKSADSSVEAGTSLRIRLDFHVPGVWPIPYVIIRDKLIRHNGGEHNVEASFVPDWYRNGKLGYDTPPLARGLYRFGRTECSTHDIFGIFEHKGQLDLPAGFTVWPRTVPIKEWKQLHRMHKGMHHHAVSTRANRETTQINGVREYNYGDRLSRIHWNATAKTGTLKSKEFERESLPRTIVVLDREEGNYRAPEQFELAVSVSASLIQYGKDSEIAFGLLSAGADSAYFEPNRFHDRSRVMLHHLVQVEANGRYPLKRVLEERNRLFFQGTYMVLVSPVKGEPIVKALAGLKQRQLVPCHIWIGPSADEGKAWCRQLASMGYTGYAVSSLEELPAVLGGAG